MDAAFRVHCSLYVRKEQYNKIINIFQFHRRE